MEYCDNGYMPRELAGLFTEDAEGTWTNIQPGRVDKTKSRADVESFFRGIPSTIKFAAHLIVNPLLNVSGDRATGKWWLFMPSTFLEEGRAEAKWLLATYEDEYTCLDGVWLFSKVVCDVKFVAAYQDGWVTR